ncbi:NHL repeat-containing protein [Geothrix alkalitolerans]|uniref:NHL repeat-containing protein n=1 Tax=Geothrix alkalitolerans TaxID=2922724 RepID=UPI001FAF88AB|nr:NHL repeat-containing protein [Geothrix alkalitolerans]
MTGRFILRRRWALSTALAFLSGLGLAAQATLPTATPLRSYDKGFREPVRLATDSAGRLYVADPRLGTLTIRDEAGKFLTIRRGLDRPLGVAVDASGRIFVCEAGKGRVSIFTPGWVPSGYLGQGDGEFQLPNHLQITPDGLVYVVDSLANQVKVYGPDNQLVRQFGTPGIQVGQLNFPTGLAVAPTGEIFVSDQGNERVQVFDANGAYLRKFGGPIGMIGSNTTFGRIQGMLADAQGRLFLADSYRGVVVVVNAATGAILGNLGSFGSDPGQLSGPASLVVDRNHRLFVAAPGNTRVEIYGLDAYTDPHILSADLTVKPTQWVREDPDHQRFSALATRPRGPQARRSGELPEIQRRHLVSVLIKVPGVDPSTIQGGSLTANGLPATRIPGAFLGDFDRDGRVEYQAWFDQDRLLATLPDGSAFLVLSGRLTDGRAFESIADVTVVNPTGSVQ